MVDLSASLQYYDPVTDTWGIMLQQGASSVTDGVAPVQATSVFIKDIAAVVDGFFRQVFAPDEADRVYFLDDNFVLRVYHREGSMELP